MAFFTTSTDLELTVAIVTTGIRENEHGKAPTGRNAYFFHTKELKCFAKQVSGNMS